MVNYLAVLVSAIIYYGLGALWYSVLFGKQWMKLNGLEEKDKKSMKEGVGKSYAIGFLTALVTSAVLSFFVSGVGNFFDGAMIAFWLWLGFVATVTMGSVLWDKKPWGLYLLNNAYNLVGILIMGGILAVWV